MKKHTSSSKKIRLALIAIVLVVATAGLAAVILLSQQTQDTRQQASVEDNLVKITHPTITAKTGESTTLPLKIDTQGSQITGVQLQFQLEGTFASEPTLAIISASGLSAVSAPMTKTASGYEGSVIALPAPGQPISFAQPTDFATLTFTPTSSTVSIKFDNTSSMAILHNDTTLKNQLQALADISLTVQSAQQATATTPPQTPAITPSPSSTSIPATPTPTATPQVAIGGDTGKSCNESCSSPAQCARNLTCYDGVCRLATNPSSATCVNPPDTGIHRSCNEYCSDNNECAGELVCWYNRCRNEDNVQSTTCAAPVINTPPSTTSYTTSQTTQRAYPTPVSIPSQLAQAPTTSDPANYVEESETYAEESTDEYPYIDESVSDDSASGYTDEEVLYDEPMTDELPADLEYEMAAEPTSRLPLILGGVSLVGLIAAAVGFGAYKFSHRNTDDDILSSSVEHPVSTPPTSMSSFAGPTSVQRPTDTPPPVQ